MVAAILLMVVAAGWMGERKLRRERWVCLRLCREVERSAAPDEWVVVDDRVLGWCLRHVGSMELRRKTVFVGSDGEAASPLLPGQRAGASEFVLVTTEDDPLLTEMSARGWTVHEAADERPRVSVGHGAVEIFFVTGRCCIR